MCVQLGTTSVLINMFIYKLELGTRPGQAQSKQLSGDSR